MSTIINIANELQALQGRITADKASLMEAKAMMAAEQANDDEAEEQDLAAIVETFNRRHLDRRTRRDNQFARLMAFIDGQIAAKDEAIEGDTQAVPVNDFKQAAE